MFLTVEIQTRVLFSSRKTVLYRKLLGETPITSIFVDGGNRKWIGTRGAGLFLVSPEGLQTLQQFTATNSPLLANDILSIAADPTSGELLIATAKGLIGYRGDATPGYAGNVPEACHLPQPGTPRV
jgi:ligand-binding sensor domain-containing protein